MIKVYQKNKDSQVCEECHDWITVNGEEVKAYPDYINSVIQLILNNKIVGMTVYCQNETFFISNYSK